jgi:hypothetical protein
MGYVCFVYAPDDIFRNDGNLVSRMVQLISLEGGNGV